MKQEIFSVTGMSCAACQANIEKRVSRLEGVEKAEVSLLANRMTVTYDEGRVTEAAILHAVEEIGYGASPLSGGREKPEGLRSQWERREQEEAAHTRGMRARLRCSVLLMLPLMYLAMGHMLGLPLPGSFRGVENALVNALTQLFLALAVVIVNGHFFTSGFRALYKGVPNMDSLVAMGASAALIYGVYAVYRMAYGLGHGDPATAERFFHELYFESSAMILTLVTVGKYLETRSKAKTTGALGKLIDLAPKTALVLRSGVETRIPAEQVRRGDELVIRPGERLPVDGVVLRGAGYLDQSAITGESVPVEKNPGDEVLSATVNLNGSFTMRASKVGDDTTLAQIIRLVDEASGSKAPIARLADRVSGVFVPVVMGIALVTAAAWLLAGKGFAFAFSCGITVLVISCPCALGLATPVAIMAGTGKGAELGILFKSAESLETLHRVDTVVLDKTGTITSGKPEVTDIRVLAGDMEANGLLALAAALEKGSEHPLAAAVVEKASSLGLSLPQAEDFRSVPGRGVTALVDGSRCYGGNAAYMKESGVTAAPPQAYSQLAGQGKTPLLFAREGVLLGVVAVADVVRADSRDAVAQLRRMGLTTVMLTGDNRATAEAIQRQVGVDEIIPEVLPAGKEERIRALQAQGRRVAMVGDGINDAPALIRADVGVAIGAGTDIALDAADVVLMKSSLMDAVTGVRLSRAVIRNIHMNLFWAFFYNVLCIPIAAGALYPALGIRLEPMIGAAAMSLSSLFVVGNALRLRFFGRSGGRARGKGDVYSATKGTTENAYKEEKTMKKELIIEGMMCAHCQSRVEKALSAVPGVTGAAVELKENKAIVTLAEGIEDAALVRAVEEAGYEVKGVSDLA